MIRLAISNDVISIINLVNSWDSGLSFPLDYNQKQYDLLMVNSREVGWVFEKNGIIVAFAGVTLRKNGEGRIPWLVWDKSLIDLKFFEYKQDCCK